mgnify:CR=1 FL=1
MQVAILKPGDIVVMDNLGSHKSATIRQAIKRTLEDTWRHIGRLVETIQPDEWANYLKNAGYASVKT